jgi:hypothetical protein
MSWPHFCLLARRAGKKLAGGANHRCDITKEPAPDGAPEFPRSKLISLVPKCKWERGTYQALVVGIATAVPAVISPMAVVPAPAMVVPASATVVSAVPVAVIPGIIARAKINPDVAGIRPIVSGVGRIRIAIIRIRAAAIIAPDANPHADMHSGISRAGKAQHS